jgi:hypothetical protein
MKIDNKCPTLTTCCRPNIFIIVCARPLGELGRGPAKAPLGVHQGPARDTPGTLHARDPQCQGPTMPGTHPGPAMPGTRHARDPPYQGPTMPGTHHARDPPCQGPTMPGTRQGPAKDLPGTCQGPARDLPGSCQGPARDLLGTRQGPARDLPGTCQDPPGTRHGSARDPPGTRQGPARDPPGTRQGPARDPPGTRQGPARDPPGTPPEAFRHLLPQFRPILHLKWLPENICSVKIRYCPCRQLRPQKNDKSVDDLVYRYNHLSLLWLTPSKHYSYSRQSIQQCCHNGQLYRHRTVGENVNSCPVQFSGLTSYF